MSTLYVCYSSSDYYARETGISLLSFLEHNKDYEPNEVFILDYGIENNNRSKLDRIAELHGKTIIYIDAKTILEKIQVELNLKAFRGSLATYSRAFIDKIMPDYVDKLLYIDSDTIVNDSCSELRDFDMGECCMAACIASSFYSKNKIPELVLLTNNEKYFTCGIVLFSLKNWKKIDAYQMIASTLKRKSDYLCADQTLINNSIPELYLAQLPYRFNYTSHIYNKRWEYKRISYIKWISEDEFKKAREKPAIIHYPGNPLNRPWYDKCLSPQKEKYLQWRRQSPWNADNFYSIDEYKKTLTTASQKVSYLIKEAEYIVPSYSFMCLIWKLYSLLSKAKRKSNEKSNVK